MTTDAISPLRQRMIEDMSARKLGAHTQKSHISRCKRFAAFLKRSPDTANAEDVRRFQLHLIDTGSSICNRNRIMTGLKFLFRVTLRRLDLAAEIYHIKEPQKIPLVISPDEAKRLLAMAGNLKVHVMLSPETLDLLRQWWKVRPTRHDEGVPLEQRWLFPGRTPGKPMTTRQLNRLFHQAADAAGTAPSVRRQRPGSGWKSGKPSCWSPGITRGCHTSTLSTRCPARSPTSPTRTRPSSTTSCSRHRRKPPS